MIEQLVIQNFQSHKKTTLDLGQITVITGHSDAGKSALLRAIEALCFNQPGTAFVRMENGVPTTHCSILLKLTNGVVMWQKTESGANYTLRETGKPDRKFTKLGRTIPDEVTEFLGIDDILIDKDTTYRLQFGSQHEMPFLVGDRGGVAAARVLGRLTGLNTFTNANRRAVSAKLSASNTTNSLRERETKILVDLGTYEEVEAEHANLRNLQNKWQLVQPRQSRLTDLRARRETLALAKKARAAWVEPVGAEETFTAMGAVLWRLTSRIVKLANLKLMVEKLQALKQVKRAPLPAEPPPFLEIDSRLRRLHLMQQTQRELQTRERLASNVTKCGSELVTEETRLREFEQQIPLCPWVEQFASAPAGTYRCEELSQLRKKTA